MSYKPYIFAVYLAVFAWNVNSFSQQFLGNMKHPDLSDHCYFEEYNITVPVNKTVYPIDLDGICFKVYCREDFVLQIKHCERMLIHRGCDEGHYDYSKPYPHCCPTIKCKNSV